MTRIILIGYMGAGKTTVGKALAKALGVTFYDLDWYIETRMRRTVKQIFDQEGEEGFRRIECCMRWLSLKMLCCRVAVALRVSSIISTI